MRIASAMLDLVFSPICLGCDGAIAMGEETRLLCRLCRSRLRPPPRPLCTRCGAPLLRTGRSEEPGACPECRPWEPHLRRVRSAFLLQPPADRLIHQVKYRGWRDLAVPMGELLARAMQGAELAAGGLVVPVPTTSARLRSRGYNQAELLAGAFARRSRRPLAAALSRASAGGTQIRLQPAARRANVAGNFHLAPDGEAIIAGRPILLVDDVLTTGATLTECARVLVEGGAGAVEAVTFARALPARRFVDS